MGRARYSNWQRQEWAAAHSRNLRNSRLKPLLKKLTLPGLASFVFCASFLAAQLPLEPVRDSGQSITGGYEGWYPNPDGSFSFLVGYFNRNQKETLEIPIGPNNRIEPGGPDQGQPTHFLPSRQWGVFTIKIPTDLGTKKLTWTLVANGQTNTITLHTIKEWVVEPFEDPASKNTPPVIKFDPDGAGFTGPPVGVAAKLTATASEPLALSAWISDEPAKLNVGNALLVAPGDAPAAASNAAGPTCTSPSRSSPANNFPQLSRWCAASLSAVARSAKREGGSRASACRIANQVK